MATAAPLNRLIDGEPSESEDRHVVAGEAFFRHSGRAAVRDRCGTQRVKTENARGHVGRDGDEAFRAAAFMVLAGIALQVVIESAVPAVEGGAIIDAWQAAILPKPASRNSEAGLAGAHQALRGRRRIFEQFEHAQGVALRQRHLLGFADIGFGLRQHVAQDIARQVEPLECCGARVALSSARRRNSIRPLSVTARGMAILQFLCAPL